MATNKPSPQDLSIFIHECVFLRSLSRHQQMLFEHGDPQKTERMRKAAEILFGDLNRLLIEHIVLGVCKITDAARDRYGNESLTIDFLLEHYQLKGDARLVALRDQIKAFSDTLRPARNKLISHSDRKARVAGNSLGASTPAEWDAFWDALGEFLELGHSAIIGDPPFKLDDVAMLSDADGLHRDLKLAELFDRAVAEGDPAAARACADLTAS